MPINHVAPEAAAPADRLNLAASTVRSAQASAYGLCAQPYCFADEDAMPSSPPPICGGQFCAAADD